MKSNLILWLVLIAMFGLFMLNGMSRQASSAFGGGASTLLHTSLDDVRLSKARRWALGVTRP